MDLAQETTMPDSLLGRLFARAQRRRSPRGPRPSGRPWMEVLEARSLLSSFYVTSANDSGPGSLRQAILDSNATTGNGRNLIDFTPQVTGPIELLSPLPALDHDVTLRAPGSNRATVERSAAAGTPACRGGRAG
jgi:hypothetical protein